MAYFSGMRTALILSAGLFVLAFITAGCSSSKKTDAPAAATASIKAHCDVIKTLSTCTDYDEKAFTLGEGFMKGACEAMSGKWTQGTCPTEKLLGTCAIEGGQHKRYYAEGTLSYKVEDAAKDCKDLSNGTWTAK
jgi:hypothetical protein